VCASSAVPEYLRASNRGEENGRLLLTSSAISKGDAVSSGVKRERGQPVPEMCTVVSCRVYGVKGSGTTYFDILLVSRMCRYTSLPAFTLPKAAQGFKSCEMTMGRRNVHACHAGALVHSLEGWKHHEVR
jgi:hypothetical protein